MAETTVKQRAFAFIAFHFQSIGLSRFVYVSAIFSNHVPGIPPDCDRLAEKLALLHIRLFPRPFSTHATGNRVLHMLDVVADNGITAAFRLARPHWNNMAWLSYYAKYPNPLQMYGWMIVLKSIAHGSKCPIELCLPIDVGWKFSWLMKFCSEFTLHLPDAANEVTQIVHVYM